MMAGREADRRLYVVAYDISSDRRRRKVHESLCGFGQWTQYSLFECHLSEKELLLLRGKLDKLLEPDEDSLRFYPLCAACVGKVETIGSRAPEERHVFIV
jgi:CRISPR-associated protein Cas2